jgi:SpoVK/Ycf46/Vps4 family AAA+-type ATPase
LPTGTGRRDLFKINLKTVEVEDSVDWDKLVEITDGYSGADIANVCRDAAMMPLRRKLADVENIEQM